LNSREGRAGTQIKADKNKVNKIEAGQGTEGEHQKVESQEVLGCRLFLSGLQDASYHGISCNELQ
jgi:hypothetical protein